jgi:hypothetical protein
MKLPILAAAIAAVALVGVASAQSRGGGAYAPGPGGSVLPGPQNSDGQGNLSQSLNLGFPPDLGGHVSGKRIIPLSARNDVGLLCPADKVKLCDSATTEISAYRCLIFHHSKLSTPCQHAVDELTADTARSPHRS